MPKKTKKQKIRSSERKTPMNQHEKKMVHKQKEEESKKKEPEKIQPQEDNKRPHTINAEMKKRDEHDAHFVQFFRSDLRKSGIAIAIILAIQGLLYYALSTNAFSIQSYLPF